MNPTAEFLQRVVQPDPSLLTQVTEPDDTTAQILQGALEQFELVGVRHSTMEDIARRCRIGRASLYRRFPTKAQLVDAVVLKQVRLFFEGSAQAIASADNAYDSIVNATAFNLSFVRDNSLLNKLLLAEPDSILPSLTVDAYAILNLAVSLGTPMIAQLLYPDSVLTPAEELHVRTVAEVQTRLTLSLLLTPESCIKLETADDIRMFVDNYLLPMARRPSGNEAGVDS
ncbi:TetR family transcriptional regulator [Mycobacteroides abscessus subsp. massiliense]|uniref:TetR/AcrR family transcriptional regulator n=1 Tax=Mycobacteroides abscessus TaxID=36809 RepID=UPI0009A8D96D|nr:TetR/AcrR family transcriptional regulator [Mycobacteroides abscessus]SKU60364.1 TetR family transcriptional regulator [Mycobacteroides abscessus subsp. massiliense]